MKAVVIVTFLVFLHSIAKSQTYYGYKERDPSGQVNWSQVGKDLNTAITEASRARQEKLAQNGWSSEYEYQFYKRQRKLDSKYQKIQNKLRKKYTKGSKKVYSMQNPSTGKITYHKR